MKIAIKLVVWLAALGALLGGTASQATNVAEKPLKASVLAKPNVILGMDDSGSMDSELLLNTSDGVFWWNFDTARGWDAAGALYRHINLGEYWSSTWRRYFYLFPNGYVAPGDGSGRNIKPDNAYGDWALPPTSEFAWARSSAYNPQYYNPAITYSPWAPANTYAAFANATPTAARGHPLYGGGTNVVDLTATRTGSTGAGYYFIAVNGMKLPAGAQYSRCNSTLGSCGAWTAVGATDMAALATYTYKLSMDYWPATYWVPATGDWTCVVPGAPSVGADSCALAPDGQKLRRIEIRPGVTSYPSGRGYAAELQNFANWFQFHRKRRLSANAAMGDTLESLRGLRMGAVRMGSLPGASTRVTMYDLDSNTASANGQALLKFLYEIDTNLGTPTRPMLKRIGDEFQNSAGPIQYACQRNVAMVVTDGYAAASTTTPPAYNAATWGSGAPYATTYAGTLADIALSYYTNTMGSASFPTGKVPASASDTNTRLHMNTYAVTLGARGDLFNGESTPYPTTTSAWVNPNTDFNPSAVDDLWHAAINGRGKLYLASAASDTAAKLQAAFSDILSQQGAQGGIAVSTVNLQRGDQRAYVGTYNPAGWTGDLTAVPINATTGATGSTPAWSASALLLARDWTTRVIASHDGSAGVPFTAAAVGSLVNPSGTWGVTAEVMAYLRGDRSNEGTKFRSRSSLLGAVINSEPFVARDDGVVYVASGEGMLHAFDSRDQPGKELWAYVPQSVLPDIGQTSARSYAFNTQLDGSPVVGRTGASSKLLVAGSGAAGRSYYAIDVSSPRGLAEADLAARVKWEFPAAGDASMQAKVGQALGRPSIVKLGDGSYTVLVSSGYNNTADGKGRLWMLDPTNGAVVAEMVTADGSLASESGLTHFSPFVEGDGTVRYVFGGDLLGNVWKFDLVARTAPAKVAVLKNAAGTPQPVTAPPELLWYANKRIVLIGTGRLLDITDFGNSSVQSFYAIADGATLANARGSLVQQTYTRATDTVSTNPVNWSTGRGWFMDLPAGEHENTRPVLSRGAISFVTNVAGGSDCTASSYLYVLDVLSGQKFAGATFAGTQISATTNSSGVNALLTDGGTPPPCVSDCPPPPPPPPPGDCQHIVGTGQTADGSTWRRDITTCVTINPSKNAWREIRR